MAFVITENKLTGLIAPITPFYGSSTEWLNLEEGSLTTFSDIYRTQPSVRSVVQFIAGHCARLPINLWKQEDGSDRTEGAREFQRKHPLQKLLAVPNGNRRVGRSTFWNDAWMDFLIYDRLCLVKIRNLDSGDPVALVRIPPVWFTPHGQNYWHPETIHISGNRGFADFPIEDCVYIHGYDPTDPRIGVSPLTTLKSILEEEAASVAWRRRFWENGAQPSMIVSRPVDAPDWEDAARDRFIESLRAAANRGKPLLLEEGMLAESSKAFNPASTEYTQGKKVTREEVLRQYNLPVGLFEQANSSNLAQYRSMLYQESLAPLLSRFTDELETQLLTEWSDDPYDEGLYLETDTSVRSEGNLIEQIAALNPAIGAPFILRSEGRGILNLPVLPPEQHADSLILPTASGLADAAPPEAPAIPSQDVGGLGGAPENPANQNGPAKPAEENDTATRVDVGGASQRGGKTRPRQLPGATKVKAAFIADIQTVLEKFYLRQRASITSKKATGSKIAVVFNKSRWNKELSADILAQRKRVANYYGNKTAEELGGKYDEDRTDAYLEQGADGFADSQNTVTMDLMEKADHLDKLVEIFDHLSAGAEAQAAEQVSHMQSFGVMEAAKQVAVAAVLLKVWSTTSSNPRPTHAAIDGETVDVKEPFSNGMMYPHDPAGSLDETAGCVCEMTLVPSDEGVE